MVKVITKYMTNNDCYKTGIKIKPKGIMVHSTATPGIRMLLMSLHLLQKKGHQSRWPP